MNNNLPDNEYLKPTYYFDYEESNIKELAEKICNGSDLPVQKAIKLYYYVRDAYAYNPYYLDLRKSAMKASYLVNRKHGYCIEKAIILTAMARYHDIPTRLGFGNVKNHLGTTKLEEYLGTDVLVFHGFVEFYLNNKWVKCTPAFNKELCEKLSVEPLEFDGINDSVFQECDKDGNTFMEYLHFYGTFADMPMELFVTELQKYYPILWQQGIPESYGRFTLPDFEISVY